MTTFYLLTFLGNETASQKLGPERNECVFVCGDQAPTKQTDKQIDVFPLYDQATKQTKHLL